MSSSIIKDTSEALKNEIARAVIYCRVSTPDQEKEGHGLVSQETRSRQFAEQNGLHVEAVFPDTKSGGGDFMKRPGMVALLSFLDAQPDEQFVVIFDDLKRFARDRDFHFRLRDAFRQRNAQIKCLNFNFEDTPEGEFIETIMAAQGQLERMQNARQVAQKMKARMQNGYWVHNAPVGYHYKTIRGHGKVLVAFEPLASIVREGIEGYASGRFQSQAEVKRFFEGFPDFPRNKHGEIKQQRVTDMLTNPIYTGHICSETYDINWLKGQHEGLIAVATFDKVQERREGVAKFPMRRNIGDDFALRGIACCAGCNVPFRSSWSKGKYKQYAYYLCQTKSCDHYGKSIARDKIENDIGEVIRQLQPSHTLVNLITAMFKHAWDTRLEQAKVIQMAAKRKLHECEKQIDTLLGRLVETSNPSVITAYENKITTLDREKALWNEKATKTPPCQHSFEEKLELAVQFIASPWKLWSSNDIKLQRLVLKLAFADRILYDRNEGDRTPKLSLPFKALEGVIGGNSSNGAAEEN
jgi:site-specific DNA recombinase